MAAEKSFAQRLWQMGSDTMLVHGIALGSKLGIFDVIADLDQPETAEVIAKKMGFKER